MSNKLILYNVDMSPPVRAVKVVAKLIGVELELRDLNLNEGEHLKEPFKSLNPQHSVPTLDDNGFVVWDSHAVCSYLVDKYAKDDTLYPKDLQLRATCNQRMYFDAASLFSRLSGFSAPIRLKGATEIPKEAIEPVNETYDILEAFLVTDPFLVGQSLTIADICVALSLPFLENFVPFDAKKHSKILAWLDRVNKTIPFFEQMNGKYKKQYNDYIMGILEENKRKLK